MEQSAQENKSIIMTITIVRGSLWWKTCWNKIAFESNLQGLSFVMVLEASISYLMCALVMLISSVFFSILWYFFTFVCLFCFDLFFFLIPSKLNDDLMHLNYGKDTLQLNTLLLITWFITLVRYMKRFLSSDWLREMQFSGNSVQKRVNSVPRSNKPDWTFLELFSRTLNFFEPKRWENIIVCYCFDRTRLFWPNAQCHLQGLNKLFLHLMRALCFCTIMITYLVFFHVYY